MANRFLFLLILLTTGCSQKGKKVAEIAAKDIVSKKTRASEANKPLLWYDSLVLKYIQGTDNDLIKFSLNSNTSEDWLLDREENINNAGYFVFHIGHDVADSGNTNPRFVTDGWLYIDTLTKKMFAYDVPHDSLIEWREKK
jgi:hypothetical protein